MKLLARRSDRPVDGARRRPARPAEAMVRAGADPNGPVGPLRAALDQGPGVQAQLRLQRDLDRSPRLGGRGNVVQRTIRWEPGLRDDPGFAQVADDPLYQELAANLARIYITRGPQDTAAIAVKAHNADEIAKYLQGTEYGAGDLDYIVNISTSTLAARGTGSESSRAYTRLGAPSRYDLGPRPDAPRPEIFRRLPGLLSPEAERDAARFFSPRAPTTALDDLLLPGLGLPGPDAPDSVSLAPHFTPTPALIDFDALLDPRRPAPKKEPTSTELRQEVFRIGATLADPRLTLSLHTVLLHELGHIRQSLRTPRVYKGPPKEIKVKSAPPPPEDVEGRVSAALDSGRLDAPVWMELLDFKNTADEWLALVRDEFTDTRPDPELRALAEATIALGDDLAPYVQVWLEYDVITGVEHPRAVARGEAIRHLHGVEQTIGGPAAQRRARARQKQDLPEQERTLLDAADKGPGPSLFAELTLHNELNPPGDLLQLRALMVGNAQRLTARLPGLLHDYVDNYRRLRASV
jgi:hypothetical protein